MLHRTTILSLQKPGACSQDLQAVQDAPGQEGNPQRYCTSYSYLRRRTAYPRTPAPISRAVAGKTTAPNPMDGPPLGGSGPVFSIFTSCLTSFSISCATAVGISISIATRATMAR